MESTTMIIKDKQIIGYSSLPMWLRKKYFEYQDYCDHCKCKLTLASMDVHRLTRKNNRLNPGLYTVEHPKSKYSNVQILCLAHHQMRHANELNHVSHRY